jgi:two-component system, OmpR family, osmolarity sensor histidine kinase EnvZ
MTSSREFDTAALAPPSPVATQGWLRRVLPRSLFGRSLIIIVTPLILLQIIVTWFFYDRHWNIVSRRLSTGVAGEIALLVDDLRAARSEGAQNVVMSRAERRLGLVPSFHADAFLPETGARFDDRALAQPLAAALTESTGRPFLIDNATERRYVRISLQLGNGILEVLVPRERLVTSTTYIFLLWMVGSSIVLFAVATVFMRNQVRSIRRLAIAAESFGKGRPVPRFKLEGPAEVRRTAAAFLAMRDRIQRQISQRTEMLAGVSHDLKTPLTRMKLALALVGEGPTVEELRSDVADMERMIQGYLDFARGEGAEPPADTDLAMLLEQVAAEARREGAAVSLAGAEECLLPLRPNAIKRCVTNLVGNARRYGSHIWITLLRTDKAADVLIDDDGCGIPIEHREAVFRPFFRLDPSRNPSTGGVGLGLTIARDVARVHGGELTLETSPQGGLRARLHLPL